MSQNSSQEIQLSAYCVIDHSEANNLAPESFSPMMLLQGPLYMVDRKTHFTGFRGAMWRLLGVDRSTKNPNICNN